MSNKVYLSHTMEYDPRSWNLMYDFQQDRGEPTETFYYQPDHLGSSNWITDEWGKPVQYLRYLPCGELWMHIHFGEPARYTFSGKEKNAETGYSYFGARYYDANLSIWLSVDPMADKYPSLLPYTYCANNPIKLVDPDRMQIDPASQEEWNARRTDIETERSRHVPFALANKILGKNLFEESGNRYNRLTETLETMDILESSDQMYSLENRSGNTEETYRNGDGTITFAYSNTSLFVHEVTHGGQYENGDVGFMSGQRGAFVDVYDELNAYKAQAAYNPHSLPKNNHPSLTKSWLLNIKNNRGQYNYRSIGQTSFNGYSNAAALNTAFPGLNPRDQFNFSGYLRNQPGVIFKR